MQNFGAQLSINIQLDGSITEMCKELARKRLRMEQQKLDKEQLDYHLDHLYQLHQALVHQLSLLQIECILCNEYILSFEF